MSDYIELGDRAKDMVSGWTGIVTARHEYLNGCVRYTIESSDKDGKPEAFAFDEQQIQVTEYNAVTPIHYHDGSVKSAAPAHTGGPRDHSAPGVVGH